MSIGGRTYLELQQEVLSFQFAEGKYRPLVKRWLNDAQQIAVIQSEIRSMRASASYTTEAGEEALELPEDFGRLVTLHVGDELLEPMETWQYDEQADTDSGTPSHYMLAGDEILLYPAPDQALSVSLRYWKVPTDMVADADEPSIPKQYHGILVSYAMSKAYLRENDYNAAKIWDAEWQASLSKMRGEVQSDSFDGPRQVAGTWGDRHAPSVWG